MILIVDFGSQYNQLIARRVREHQVYCQIEPPDISLDQIRVFKPEGIILSGGDRPVSTKRGAPKSIRESLTWAFPYSESVTACSTW